MSQEFGARWAIGLGAVAALGAGAWGISKARRVAAIRASDECPVTADDDAEAIAEVVFRASA